MASQLCTEPFNWLHILTRCRIQRILRNNVHCCTLQNNIWHVFGWTRSVCKIMQKKHPKTEKKKCTFFEIIFVNSINDHLKLIQWNNMVTIDNDNCVTNLSTTKRLLCTILFVFFVKLKILCFVVTVFLTQNDQKNVVKIYWKNYSRLVHVWNVQVLNF